MWEELIRTDDESRFFEARAALEAAEVKYRTHTESEESRHMMHRSVNPDVLKQQTTGFFAERAQQGRLERAAGVSGGVKYVIEVRKHWLDTARKAIG